MTSIACPIVKYQQIYPRLALKLDVSKTKHLQNTLSFKNSGPTRAYSTL